MKLFFKILFFSILVIILMPHSVHASESRVFISEIFYDAEGKDTGKEYIIISNGGDFDIDMTGFDLDPSSAPYFTFPTFTLSSGNSVLIFINKEGTDTDTEIYTGLTSNMSNTKGPVALFSSSEHTAVNLVDYVSYGEGGQANASKAVKQGLWTASSFIPLASDGEALIFDGVSWSSLPPTYAADEIIETTEEIIIETIIADALVQDAERKAPQTTSLNQSQASPTLKKITQKKRRPELVISAPTLALLGDSLRFDSTESFIPDDGLLFIWEFGNSEGLAGVFTEYAYHATGTYVVTLSTIYDGNVYTKKHTIIISDNTALVPPSISVLEEGDIIYVSEFIPNPLGNDAEGEWIEIINTSSHDIDIAGWKLDDKDGGSKPYTFPINTIIPAEDFLLLLRSETKLALNNTADVVRFISPSNRIVQEVVYSNAPEGMSYSFLGKSWQWTEDVTPGEENNIFNSFLDNAAELHTPFVSLGDISQYPDSTHVSVNGIVAVPPELFAQSYFYVVDSVTDEGNIVRGIKVTLPRTFSQLISIGDHISFTGTYIKTGVEPRIKIHSENDLTIIDSIDVPSATLLSSEFISDSLLGSYITIGGEIISRKGNNIYLDDGVEEIRAYIYPHTNIPLSELTEGDFYEVSGILSKTRSGFRLLPIRTGDIKQIVVQSAHTENTPPNPVKVSNSEKEFLWFLIITGVVCSILLIGISFKIKKRSAEIDSLSK